MKKEADCKSPLSSDTDVHLTPMQIAYQRYLDRERSNTDRRWCAVVVHINELLEDAAERGVIEGGPVLVLEQEEMLKTVDTFHDVSPARLRHDGHKRKGRSLDTSEAHELDLIEHFLAGEFDKEFCFQHALERARGGDWFPLWGYFNECVRPGICASLAINFGVYVCDGTVEDADDILQDAWEKTLQHFPRLVFDDHYRFFGWFKRLASNRVMDIIRRRSPFYELNLEDKVAEYFGAYAVFRATDIERALEIRRMLLAMESQTQRDVIILKYFLGYTNLDVARILGGKTEGSIKSLQHRALGALGRMIELIDSEGESLKRTRIKH